MPRSGTLLLIMITVNAALRYTGAALTKLKLSNNSGVGNNLFSSTRHHHARQAFSTGHNNRALLQMSTTSSVMKTGSVPVQLKYTEYKDKDHEDDSHTPVILLHGLLGSKRNFASLGTSLTRQLQKKRRVLALDLRNHGENEHDWRKTSSAISL
uniref:AB hydrolase-1 domain-containing protein n=1 Tax=Leptocylindrus danicus TaxID=163516 RepID=A0A7S2L2V5_9STRA